MHNCSPAVVFHRVLFGGEDVSHINPLYEEVFGSENESDCEFLGWQTKTGARSFFYSSRRSDYRQRLLPVHFLPVIKTEIYREKINTQINK